MVHFSTSLKTLLLSTVARHEGTINSFYCKGWIWSVIHGGRGAGDLGAGIQEDIRLGLLVEEAWPDVIVAVVRG